MHRLALISICGGVGRSTLSALLATATARQGQWSLLLEWDPRNLLAWYLGARYGGREGIARAALDDVPWQSAGLRADDGTLLLPFGRLTPSEEAGFAWHMADEPQWLAKRLDTLGGVGTVAIAGGAYVGGLLADQPRVREFGADAALSMLVAQSVTIPVKILAGRFRPDQDAGPYHFKPLGGSQSFPSGHATQAFTLAAVISEYADNPWGSAAAYGGAVLVGLARLEQRAHFVSDVVAGAVVGTLAAKAVMQHHRFLRSGPGSPVSVSWAPVCTADTTGLLVSLRF